MGMVSACFTSKWVEEYRSCSGKDISLSDAVGHNSPSVELHSLHIFRKQVSRRIEKIVDDFDAISLIRRDNP